jgi:hypothetical protein
VVILDQIEPLLLIQRKPYRRIGWRERIIFIHDDALDVLIAT